MVFELELKLLSEAYDTIAECSEKIDIRRKLMVNRMTAFATVNKSIVKVAFDSRYINQSTEYNPRRGLQFYQRSDAFVSTEIAEQVKLFHKVKTAVELIKCDFLGDPEWLDSNSRVLSASLDRILRTAQKDAEFFKPQLDYLTELLSLRYRMTLDDIKAKSEQEIKTIILSKDERLCQRDALGSYSNYKLTEMEKQSVSNSQMKTNGDTFFDKIFGVVKADAENKEVERSVTITIKDKIVE